MGFSEVTTRLLASEMLVRASTGGGHLEGGAGQCRVSLSQMLMHNLTWRRKSHQWQSIETKDMLGPRE